LGRGLAYGRKGDYDNAIADFDEAIRLKPNDAEAILGRGFAYEKKGDYDNAIKDFSKAIELEPNDAEAFNNRGFAYRKKGEHDKAIADFDEAIRLKPDYAEAFFFRGLAYYFTGDYGKAIANFDAAVRLQPDIAEAFLGRGLAYWQKGNDKNCFLDFKEAANRDSQFAPMFTAFVDEKIKADIGWFLTFTSEELDTAPHYFLRLIAFCIKQQMTAKEYKALIKAVYSLWNALRCKQNDAGHIFQYTSLRVLEHERANRCFRLTPAGYQNDPEEGKVFYERLKTFCKPGAISTVLDSIRSNSETVAFIRSFTALEDTLFMWNSSYAAHGEGAAVGIAKQKINKGFGIDSLFTEKTFRDIKDFGIDSLTKAKLEPTEQLVTASHIVSMQEETEQPKGNAAEGESKKPVPVSMSSIGLYKVLYIGETSNTAEAPEDEKALNAVADNLTEFAAEFKEAYTELQAEGKGKYRTKENPFMDFLSKLFTPVAHLIKDAAYSHEKEYRLLYVYSIADATDKNYIHEEKTEEGVCNGIFIETEAILFEDSKEKDIVYFGPKVNKITRLKYEHAFRHKGLAVDFRASDIHYR
jgi:tetratricopeptide (TPR) repeat protein